MSISLSSVRFIFNVSTPPLTVDLTSFGESPQHSFAPFRTLLKFSSNFA